MLNNGVRNFIDRFSFWEQKELVRIVMKSKWKRLLGFTQDDVLGIDVGSSSVRMVQLARDNGSYAVVSAAVSDIEYPEDGAEGKEANVVKAVQSCLASAKTGSRWAVCSVSGPEVAVRHFRFPPLQPEELEGAVLLEASQVCPFNIDDAVVEFQLMQNGSNGNPDGAAIGVLVAATNGVIQRRVRIIEKASLNCVLMDVDGLALLNCLSESKRDRAQLSTAAILDVGASCTTLAVMGENGLPFVRTMRYAGNDIIKLIAAENNVRPEVIKKDIYGNTRQTIPYETLQAGLEKACQKLVGDVAESLRYHSTQEKSSPVEQILVCGGFSMVRGFVDIINKYLPIRAILWNPFDTMHCSVGRQCLDVIQSKGPVMVVAAGLAMRSV